MQKASFSKDKFGVQWMFNCTEKTDKNTIDISGLLKGIYLLNLYDRNGNSLGSKKIIKE